MCRWRRAAVRGMSPAKNRGAMEKTAINALLMSMPRRSRIYRCFWFPGDGIDPSVIADSSRSRAPASCSPAPGVNVAPIGRRVTPDLCAGDGTDCGVRGARGERIYAALGGAPAEGKLLGELLLAAGALWGRGARQLTHADLYTRNSKVVLLVLSHVFRSLSCVNCAVGASTAMGLFPRRS